MDVVKFSTYATQQTAKLYVNNGNGVWASEVMSSTLSNVTGIAAMDYNWDGAKDLIVSQQNGKIVYIQNNQEVADGTAMHLQIVDSAGINVYYGNTVQLHDSTGKLVAEFLHERPASPASRPTSASRSATSAPSRRCRRGRPKVTFPATDRTSVVSPRAPDRC